MFTFIDGASSSGARVASATAVTASSAMPAASRAIRLAVAGATIIRSARSATRIWPMSCSCPGSTSSVITARPLSAWNVNAPTNFWARRVITTVTSAPALVNRRTSSQALYAAMPPPTATTISAPASGVAGSSASFG
jgi:hypothetical protein